MKYLSALLSIDQFNCQIIKVEGHKPQHAKNNADRIFALVDKASRSAVREFNHQLSSHE